jgi:antitoxin CptB
MKELEVLLRRYACERFPGAPAARQDAFEALLELPDPQLADYLLGYATPADAELGAVVRDIRA